MAWNYTDEVSYPFGYGLSYTTFEQELTGVTYSADTDMYTVSVAVSNTGDVAGKSVVQVYAQTPYGDYEKTYNVEKAATVVAAAALIFYFTVGAPNVRVTVFLILALVCGAAGFAVKHIAADAAGILALACVTYVFCRYLYDSVSVFFDVLNGISMFGSGGDLTSVIIMLVLLLVSVFGYIVSGFMKRVGRSSQTSTKRHKPLIPAKPPDVLWRFCFCSGFKASFFCGVVRYSSRFYN